MRLRRHSALRIPHSALEAALTGSSIIPAASTGGCGSKPTNGERSVVPNSKAAKHAVKKSRQLRLRNQSVRSAIKTFVKKTKVAIAGDDQSVSVQLYRDTSSLVDKAAKHGIIHKNAANRRKSRPTQYLPSRYFRIHVVP